MWCKWSKNGVCQIIIHFPIARPLTCDGHHSACLGQAGKVRDIRDGAFKIPLLSKKEVDQ